jgi:hypothetical protein
MPKTSEERESDNDLEREYLEHMPGPTDLLVRLFEVHRQRRLERATMVKTVVTYGMHEKPII